MFGDPVLLDLRLCIYGLISELNISVGRNSTFKAEESSSQLLILALVLEVSLIDLWFIFTINVLESRTSDSRSFQCI